MRRDPDNPMGMYTLGDDHVPIPCPDTLKWGKWYETAERHVAQTTVGNLWVSTVFLGMDHQYGDGPPLLYETMVFGFDEKGERDYADRECYRYSTWDDAEAGHAAVVKQLQKQLESVSEGESDDRKGE